MLKRRLINLICEKISRIVAKMIHIEGAPVFVCSLSAFFNLQSMNWKYSIRHNKFLVNTGNDSSILLKKSK